MQKSTGTLNRSQVQNPSTTNNRTMNRQQRTATSNRTGGISSSGHISSAHKPTERARPRVFDETNADVTPKPLFDAEIPSKPRHGSALFHSIEGTSTPTDILSNGSILNTNAILTGAQSFGNFPESSTHVSNDSNQLPNDSIQEGGAEKDKELSALFITNVYKEKSPKEKVIETVNLKETSTHVLLNIPTSCVSSEDPLCEKVKHSNQKYEELCKNKVGNDSYAERAMNTFNDPPKLKSTQTEKIIINEKGVWCTVWDMYDSTQGEEDEEKRMLQEKRAALKSANSDTGVKFKSSSAGTTTGNSEASAVASSHFIESEIKAASENQNNFLENEIFKLNAFYMERLLNQNTYQNKQARYRGLKSLTVDEKPSKITQQYDGLTLEKLWTYSCSISKERNVSCIAWNKRNQDVLAAGYGKFEFNEDQSGLVCCWSLKNPEFPERYYKTEAGVTALAFSQKHANLLAVGLFNGNILVFDVRNNNTGPLLSTNESEHKHLSPVWHLKWTDKDRASSSGEEDEMEVLMSVSSDGRVTQWMIRKGFESLDYLKLKRVSVKGTQKKDKEKSDGFISRHSGGLCFDIWSQDRSIYLCGTEEGYIHRCSTSYNEQYLDTYNGHTGPIYKISWSPFLKNCFLSASADWTVRLWKTDRTFPCLTFNSSTKAVYEICWSNNSATMFCCVNETTIEIWDLSKSTLDPIYTANPPGSAKLTTISYSPNSDSLIVGTSDGSLWIYAIKNIPHSTNERELDEIIKQSLISQLESIKVDDDETKETIEKHQLDSLAANQQLDKDDDLAQKEKMDAFEAKLEKVKAENEAVMEGKSTLDVKNLAKNNKKKEKKDEEEEEDEK